jgi:hypothetical protein
MTQDEIIEMARDAGLRIDVRGTYFFVGFGELSDLLDAATAKEREACAKVCELIDTAAVGVEKDQHQMTAPPPSEPEVKHERI